ncbi:chromatin assembly factor 1 subunit A-like [Macrobrachium rosenbergii]|uniref:chromatin assembly factor 1 subunit A-like n=1 Tax=Macrobrachium rosenbergii TaxID=79674 RepID=UPI0034D57D16
MRGRNSQTRDHKQKRDPVRPSSPLHPSRSDKRPGRQELALTRIPVAKVGGHECRPPPTLFFPSSPRGSSCPLPCTPTMWPVSIASGEVQIPERAETQLQPPSSQGRPFSAPDLRPRVVPCPLPSQRPLKMTKATRTQQKDKLKFYMEDGKALDQTGQALRDWVQESLNVVNEEREKEKISQEKWEEAERQEKKERQEKAKERQKKERERKAWEKWEVAERQQKEKERIAREKWEDAERVEGTKKGAPACNGTPRHA